VNDSMPTETLDWGRQDGTTQAFLSGTGVLRRKLSGSVVRIGRGKGNQVSPQGAGLSSKHAELRLEDDGWTVIDLGSRNGTFVGGARVEKAVLTATTELRFGGAVMLFELDERLQIGQFEPLPGLVGGHAAMLELARLVRRVAPTKVPVLVLGETGVGKERVAEALHQFSGRSGAFVPINCGSFSPDLVGAELFGALRGAYTGADRDRVGAFGAAQGGTLFLDEVGELPAAVQVQLLRALESGCIRRLGDPQELPVDVRIIAATHRDLHVMMEQGNFRADLYHRLAVFPLTIAPLRDRRGDISAIATHLLSAIDASKSFHISALKTLAQQEWLGNVRELRNLITRAAILTEGPVIHGQDLALKPKRHAGTEVSQVDDRMRLALGLCAADGNLTETARQLEMSRSRLYRLLKRYGWSDLNRQEVLKRAEAFIVG
jgi:DNA-binding NtrC family response regulator